MPFCIGGSRASGHRFSPTPFGTRASLHGRPSADHASVARTAASEYPFRSVSPLTFGPDRCSRESSPPANPSSHPPPAISARTPARSLAKTASTVRYVVSTHSQSHALSPSLDRTEASSANARSNGCRPGPSRRSGLRPSIARLNASTRSTHVALTTDTPIDRVYNKSRTSWRTNCSRSRSQADGSRIPTETA